MTTAAVTVPLWADTLKLKDGTSVSGRVMDEGSNYWIKDADGQSHTIPKDQVQDWVKGDAAAAAQSAPAASAQSQAGRGSATALPAGGASFKAVKAKADRVDTPIQAVGLWQSFIDTKPPAADVAASKKELAYWTQLMNGNAERVNGKWIWGAERDKLLKQVADLMKQADEDMRANQTIKGLHEFEQAAKLYPNDFEANFEMGYINLTQGASTRDNRKMDAGVKSMETAVKLRPSSAPALSDLAIGYNFRGKYLLAVQTAYQAAKLEDNREIVQNLVNTIAQAPPGLQNNAKVKQILQEATVLAGKYGIGGGMGNWAWVPLDDEEEGGSHSPKRGHKHAGDDNEHDDSDQKGPPGIIGNGTGELLSADGYILTNRHVAKEGDYLMVRLNDGTIKVADRVVIDDEQDLAVLKIKTDAPLPFVRLAAYDHPPVGADVDVFGFPLLGMVGTLDSSVKMTRGIVTAWDDGTRVGFDGCDVTVDAAINPGNSGGPIVDHYGNLLAVATAKTGSGDIAGEKFISSYGLGQSTGHVRRFLTHQSAKLAGLKLLPGTADKQLTNEELATKMTPIAVCVFVCRGAAPGSDADAAKSAKPPGRPAVKPQPQPDN